MEIVLVATLAQAGASLNAAMEQCETGSVFWGSCLVARKAIEDLIEAEVTGTPNHEAENWP